MTPPLTANDNPKGFIKMYFPQNLFGNDMTLTVLSELPKILELKLHNGKLNKKVSWENREPLE